MMKEPTLVDDGEAVCVAEFLNRWADTGENVSFYNYGCEGTDTLEFYKDDLLPTIERMLRDKTVPSNDKANFEKVRVYITEKVAAMERGETTPKPMLESETFQNEMLVTITYDQVRQACKGENFYMRRLSASDYNALERAFNQGIDSRLQACYCPERGDSLLRSRLRVSPESLPVLIRRLYEADDGISNSLASGMMAALGFKDNGQWQDPDTGCNYDLPECSGDGWTCPVCGQHYCDIHMLAPGEKSPSCPICAENSQLAKEEKQL